MEYTPARTAAQKMEVANLVLDLLPTELDKRVDAIIEEFCKLNHTVDESFSKVSLPAYTPRDLTEYPTGLELTQDATVESGTSGVVVTPIGDADRGSDFFLDLDTGGSPRWPAELAPNDSSAEAVTAAREWAAAKGADLMCVPGRNSDGDMVYTLVGIGLQLWEIDPFEAMNIEKRITKGVLPKGREVKDALLHYDPVSKGHISKRGSSFLYVTREMGLGVLTITDFVTEVRNLTGAYSAAPTGVGFNRGVRFDYQPIAR